MNEVLKLASEIKLIKQSLTVIERNSTALGDWLPKKAVMRYFDYGETQLRVLEKSGVLLVSKVGHRKFYSKSSIIKLLDLSIKIIK